MEFGTNWWGRFGSDPADPYRYTRHAAYYNSTGIRCGRKVRRHWIIPGLIRFNGVGDFDPHHPRRSVGHTFLATNLDFLFGGNRLLLTRRLDDCAAVDFYLVVISQDLHGRINFTSSAWKSPTTQVIAASQLRHNQEVMLLMKTGGWIKTLSGMWRLVQSKDMEFSACLELQDTAI